MSENAVDPELGQYGLPSSLVIESVSASTSSSHPSALRRDTSDER
jgi:hypothetical protein